MRMIWLMLCTIFMSACSVFGVRSGTEQAGYSQVANLAEKTEVRRYPPQLVAETWVTAADEDEARSEAFRSLFAYISGANRAQVEVAMTVPVEISTSSTQIAMTVPVETQSDASGRYSMRFFLPASFTAATAPEPTDPNVRVFEIPERTLAVRRFSGSRDAEKVADELSDLRAIIKASAWRENGTPTTMFYDPPWTVFFLRRNEVSVPVETRGE